MTVGPESPFTLQSALVWTVSHRVLWLVLEDSGELRQEISHPLLARKVSIHSKKENKDNPASQKHHHYV